MSLHRYDLAVIGSGPAGQKAALAASKLGKRVAIIDREHVVGGVCIHTGTIPSKALREAIVSYTAADQRLRQATAGCEGSGVTMADLLHRANTVIRQEVEVIRSQMARNRVTVLYGTASFESPHRLTVARGDDHVELTAEKFLIAVGTEPSRPADVPFTPGRVIDSNELLRLQRLPRTMTIVGGGVIGTEYASMLAAVGVKVTLLDQRGRLLEFVDDEITEALQYRLRELGVRLRLGEKLAGIALEGDDAVIATTESGKRIRSEVLLYCVGRQGATGQLKLENAGLAVDARGRLNVNEHLQTAVPHIYAAGDVIGFPALAATAMEQGRLAAWHMFQQIAAPANPHVPYGIYTIPEVSMIGQTESQLTAAGVPYEAGVARYKEIARGQILGDPVGMLKLLFHPESRRLLGVHALGTGATELIHIGQAVMTAGLPIDYFVETVFNYPTLAECYKVAALDGLNRVRMAASWHDDGGLPARDGEDVAAAEAAGPVCPPRSPAVREPKAA
ncbi:MAG: Si-specific NAD(P)(+) transhydrogenase [Tepidisphaerales bacterium]